MAVAGFLATALGDLIIAPIDTIKTLQQGSAGSSLSMLGATQQLLQRGGPLALFAGAESYVPADAVAGGLKFFTYEWVKAWGAKPGRVPPRLMSLWVFLCGGIAFIASSIALTPGELIKQRLQTGMYNSILQGITTIWRTEGLLGFYQGYFSICLRDVPFTMLELGLYENLKNLFLRMIMPRRNPSADESDIHPTPSAARRMGAELAAGCVTGAVCGWVTNPLDVVKTRLMLGDNGGGNPAPNTGVVEQFRQLVRAGGMGALFQGATARVVWLMAFTTIYLQIYELITRSTKPPKSLKEKQG